MIKLLELFGGIGACSKALERLGIEYEIADYVEIDKYAVASFNAIHGTNFEPQDICEWNKDIDVDLIMHGSPCQDFSIAGKQAGGDEGSGTRSSLMYETLRIVEKLKPKYVIWENVKNIISKNHKHNFDKYIAKMGELGYKSYAKIMNAKNYGIPQNRERVFTISIRNDYNQTFEFPEPIPLEKKLKDMLEDNVDEKYYLSDKQIEDIQGWNAYEKPLENMEKTNKSNISPTLTTRSGAYAAGMILVKNATQMSDLRIRKLTPKECWRLMGFDDKDFEKASQVCSNAQLYKQAGNSIVVNVLEKILKNLIK